MKLRIVDHLPGMCKFLSSISNNEKGKERRGKEKNIFANQNWQHIKEDYSSWLVNLPQEYIVSLVSEHQLTYWKIEIELR